MLACCWLLILSNGGLAQTWQKVVPSGGSCNGSESSTPTYLGVTSSSYDGAQVGGFVGANEKCVAQYGAGARFMKIKDHIKLNRSTPYPQDGHINIQENYNMIVIANAACIDIDLYSYINKNFLGMTCNSYSINSVSFNHVYLSTVGGFS